MGLTSKSSLEVLIAKQGVMDRLKINRYDPLDAVTTTAKNVAIKGCPGKLISFIFYHFFILAMVALAFR